MKVAYDAAPLLDSPTGVGRYTAELASALEVQGIELKRFAFALRGRPPPGVRRMRVPARAVQFAWRHYGRPPIERLTGPVDVVHGTNFVLPATEGSPGVVTVHDLSFHRDDTFPGGDRLRDLVPWSMYRAAKVLCPTEAVAAEITSRYRVAEDRIAVTPEGVAPVFFGATPLADRALADLGIHGPFAVAAGSLEPRKNLDKLLQAWRLAADSLKGWTLVLAGPRGWGPQLPETPGVVLPGWLGDETLPGLFAAAEFFCYPSLYEGFGLPPLEAMAAGTPALVGDYPCASEVLGDSAVIVPPTDAQALAEAMVHLATDDALRRRLALKGRARATGYTWEKAAAKTIAAYRDASS